MANVPVVPGGKPSLLGGHALSKALPEPTAKFFILCFFLWFCLAKFIEAILVKWSPNYKTLSEAKKMNLVSYFMELVMECSALFVLSPSLGSLLAGEELSPAAYDRVMIAYTLVPSSYCFVMAQRFFCAPGSFNFHHGATISLIVFYQAMVFDTGITQPGTRIATLFLLETICQQLRYSAFILYVYQHALAPYLIFADAIYQFVLKTGTKVAAISIWMGTWDAYGDRWTWCWAIYLPLAVVSLYAIQLWGNVYVEMLIATNAWSKAEFRTKEEKENTDARVSLSLSSRRGSGRETINFRKKTMSMIISSLNVEQVKIDGSCAGFGDLFVDYGVRAVSKRDSPRDSTAIESVTSAGIATTGLRDSALSAISDDAKPFAAAARPDDMWVDV